MSWTRIIRPSAVACVLSLSLSLVQAAGADVAKDIGSDANPAIVHALPDAITIDGDPAKWAGVAALPAPFSRKATGMLKLAWREDGIYGLLQAQDAKITVDAFNPWVRDCLELWLETDHARSYEMTDHAYQLVLAPNPDAGAGRAIVVPANGHIVADKVHAVWKPQAGGYLIEFFVPATEIKLVMKDGAKIGMNYSVDDKGVSIEEFFTDKDMDSGFCSPLRWGVITLKP
jgi:hypothetical protein